MGIYQAPRDAGYTWDVCRRRCRSLRLGTGGCKNCVPPCRSCPRRQNAPKAPILTGCAPAKSPSNCRRGRMPRSITSAASARRGSGAQIVRRTRAARMTFAPSNSIHAGPQAFKVSMLSRMYSCFIGWTRRGAISSCNGRGTMPSIAARSPCARRRGPIRLRFRWRGSCASTATSCQLSVSIASTTRRFSTSSPISPRRIPCRRRVVGWHTERR